MPELQGSPSLCPMDVRPTGQLHRALRPQASGKQGVMGNAANGGTSLPGDMAFFWTFRGEQSHNHQSWE